MAGRIHGPARALLVLVFAVVVMSSTGIGCGLGDFEPRSKVSSVRVLASRADKPYAKPGDDVTLELLAVDGRADRSRPMRVSWIPIPCVNPRADLYYDCFRTLFDVGGSATTADAGAPGDGTTDAGAIPAAVRDLLKPGVDLSPYLPSGSKFTFRMPDDVVTGHPVVPGADRPYGLVILFNIACAGHVELVPVDPADANPQVVPLGCFDDSGKRLGADDYVFGFTRVYGYDDLSNQNPEISGITFDGHPVDPAVGITLERCTADKEMDCPKHPIDVLVPASSQEVRPRASGDGKEQISVQFATTRGTFESGTRLLYDALRGKVADSKTDFQPSFDQGVGTLYFVVKDNRGGTNWLEMPVTVR
ncbi:MAG: hypothetical protein U0169_03810 [Polyangiaceae bacterium]